MPPCIRFRNGCGVGTIACCLAPLGLALLGLALFGLATPWRAEARAMAVLDATQTTYLTHCGGCHGIEGASSSSIVPDLRDQVGLFLCTDEGRDYVMRVPNVAMSLIPDDARLAAVLNFVVLRFGGVRPGSLRPFTAGEVHEARQRPLRSTDLQSLRRLVLQRSVAACIAASRVP